MGIVHHSHYLHYFECGRVDWLRKRGVSYHTWVERGIHLPMLDAKLTYRKPARFDERLVVETTPGEVSRVRVHFSYRVLRDLDLICEGETRHVCVASDMRPTRLHDDIAAVFKSAELAGPA